MKVAVIGLGSIGSRHVDTLLAMGHEVVGYDIRSMPDEPRLPVLNTEEDLWDWQPTHVLVCTPPESHYEWAKEAISQGAHVFVEKPLATQGEDAALLVSYARQQGRTLAVGYMERAHPALVEAYQHRPLTGVTLECYWHSAPKSYALDELLESSHTLDLALWLMGPVQQVDLALDAQFGQAMYFKHAHGESHLLIGMNRAHPPKRAITAFWGNTVRHVEYGRDVSEWDACYRAELEAFLHGTPLCTGVEGLAVLELIERVR